MKLMRLSVYISDIRSAWKRLTSQPASQSAWPIRTPSPCGADDWVCCATIRTGKKGWETQSGPEFEVDGQIQIFILMIFGRGGPGASSTTSIRNKIDHFLYMAVGGGGEATLLCTPTTANHNISPPLSRIIGGVCVCVWKLTKCTDTEYANQYR